MKPFFRAVVQPKLTVNTPGDAYEQEADQVADQVMRMREGDAPVVQRMPLTPLGGLQRKCTECEKEEKEKVQRKESGGGDAGGHSAPPIVSDVLSSGGGQSMDGGTRQFMESRFGQDFGQVRIHTGGKAAESAAAIQARAYTSGRDVVFGAGEYRPESESGKRLLAHELVHVGQQGGGHHVERKEHVQRSVGDFFLGTGIGMLSGGLLGAGIGAGIGAFAGNAGMGALLGGGIGALLGGITGAATAISASTAQKRKLNEPERNVAKMVFGTGLNYDVIQVTDDSSIMGMGSTARTPGNTVFFPPGTFAKGQKFPTWYYGWLIHELTHCWQTQHGISVTKKLFQALFSTYDYGGEPGLQKAIDERKCFIHFNTEQQGDILEDYFYYLKRGTTSKGKKIKNGALYEHFVNQVKFGNGCFVGETKIDILEPEYRPKPDTISV